MMRMIADCPGRTSERPVANATCGVWFANRFAPLLFVGGLVGAATLFGCRPSAAPAPSGSGSGAKATEQWREELFDYAINNVSRLEQFGTSEMLAQIVQRLNQWVETQQPPPDWKPDAMVQRLPESLRELATSEKLEAMEFPLSDALFLRSAVWFRDASNWARGESLKDVERATELFDWTVRNVQLQSAPEAPVGQPGRIRQFAWEALLMGNGLAMERAWVFVELLRQQQIDAVILKLPVQGAGGENAEGEDAESGGVANAEKDRADERPARKKARIPWAVGALIDDQIYLFEPALGLPIPAADGIAVDDEGRIRVQPATLAEVIADPSLLRQLDLDEKVEYPVDAEMLSAGVEASIAVTPEMLSRRMALVQSKLVGENRMVLIASPEKLAERLKRFEGIDDVSLWPRPFESMLQRQNLDKRQVQQKVASLMPFQTGQNAPLWKGRVLHIKGRLSGADGATHYYQLARPADAQLAAAELQSIEKIVYQQAKQRASYWLGLVSYEIGNSRSAIDYFATRTLEATPGGPWTPGAQYNLGRTYERNGQTEAAMEQYQEMLGPGAARLGARLRAKWLADSGRTAPKAAQPVPDEKAGSSNRTQDERDAPSSEKANPKATTPADGAKPLAGDAETERHEDDGAATKVPPPDTPPSGTGNEAAGEGS